MTLDLSTPRFKRIAIIGGGPSGLAAAKALALEPVKFTKIDVFERRDRLGGLWYHNGNKALVHPEVPSTDPGAGEILDKNATKTDEFFSAIYQFMETNIIYRLMQYANVSFSKDELVYPHREQVLEYIDKYVKSIPKKNGVTFYLDSNVNSISKVNNAWQVQVENVGSDVVSQHEYDAVIVANGHFNNPFIPQVSGLAEWNEKLPNTILHSKNFQTPNVFRNKNVLVIGNAASGVDISTQISTVANKVYVSVRDLSKLDFKNDLIEYIGLINEYDYRNRLVTTIDEKIVKDIDVIIFCTGYFYSMPFLKLNSNLNVLDEDGRQVKDLYKQIFNIDDPSISFVALLKNVVPMPIAESQSALIARYYSGRYELPSAKERQIAYKEEIKKKGSGSSFHDFSYPLDVEYRQHLQELIDEKNIRDPGLVAPIWDASLIKDRSETKSCKSKRLHQVVEHVKRLRSEGKDFELPQ
ncbi:FMO1 [Candida oxycetoniae]|uniref:FMO1 n=1 Tax=Candida oxycetoniae TaxID=497107 RepID=A0AAI9SZ42_9ASCO|nr:FMO1 [Candida oxycetoniae]KAI3405339.2 FMO1 [Candida oxycetoniae]